MKFDVIHGDRRQERRYEYAMDLRFRWTDSGGRLHTGYGVTADLSAAGVRIRTNDPPPDGTLIELHIDWPFLLQNTRPLDLVVFGPTVSLGERGTFAEMRRYEFRLRDQQSFDDSAPDDPGWSVLA